MVKKHLCPLVIPVLKRGSFGFRLQSSMRLFQNDASITLIDSQFNEKTIHADWETGTGRELYHARFEPSGGQREILALDGTL